eukprot:m.63964 g.63964  ORF g.63964 m.63964 type:complete len:1224 (+) comp35209_c0_seq5:1019-4690(+)
MREFATLPKKPSPIQLLTFLNKNDLWNVRKAAAWRVPILSYRSLQRNEFYTENFKGNFNFWDNESERIIKSRFQSIPSETNKHQCTLTEVSFRNSKLSCKEVLRRLSEESLSRNYHSYTPHNSSETFKETMKEGFLQRLIGRKRQESRKSVLCTVGQFRGDNVDASPQKSADNRSRFEIRLETASTYTCVSWLALDFCAYEHLMKEAFKSNQIEEFWVQRPFLQKFFGVKNTAKELEMSHEWAEAGKLPFTHCVLRTLISGASEAPVIIPLFISSILLPRLVLLEDTFVDSDTLDIYQLLSPIREVVAHVPPDSHPPIIVIGIYKNESEFRRKFTFCRIIREALSKNFNSQKLRFLFREDRQKIDLQIQESFPDLKLEWTVKENVLVRDTLKRFCSGQDFIDKKLFDEKQLKQLCKMNVLVNISCSDGVDSADELFLLNGQKVEDILLDLCVYSTKHAIRRHGMIPENVFQEVLEFHDELEHWRKVLRFYGVLFSPLQIHCSHRHRLKDPRFAIHPRELYHLPNPLSSAYIVPHMLHLKCLSQDESNGYLRTDAFIVRFKDGYRISECFFYKIVGVFIAHYPFAPKCYYRAARLRVKPSHVLELKLENGMVHASMLVRTSDEFFDNETGSICDDIRNVLMEDAKELCSRQSKSLLQFGALGTIHDGSKDFVNLPVHRELSRDRVYTDEREECSLPPSFFFWYNQRKKKGGIISTNFAQLAEEMNVDKIFRFLIHKGKITSEEQYLAIIGKVNEKPSAVRLLAMLAKHEDGEELLKDALRSAGQMELVKHLTEPQDILQSKQVQAAENSKADPKLCESQSYASSQTPLDEQINVGKQLLRQDSGGLTVSVPPSDNAESPYNPSGITRNIGSPMFDPGSRPVVSSVFQAKAGLPVSSMSEFKNKGEPTVTPVFEAKYYHVDRASDHFNEKPFSEGGKRLGSGSFGTVYHGVLHSENGHKFEVAIKRLKKASSLNPAQIEICRKQFSTELNMLTRYVNKNVISLIGFSSDGPELCLIFQFMSNGALSHRLDCRDNTPPLPWRLRLSISCDIACGLHFLHNEYRQPVIHRDIKSSNVLLSQYFEAKISDFGLAIVGGNDTEDIRGSAVGTRPYMSPESFHKVCTEKTDVYSYGVVLYELATGLPPYSSKKKMDLKAYVDDIESQRIDLIKMLDPKAKWPKNVGLEERSYGLDLLKIAKKCTVKDSRGRSTTKEILPYLKQLHELSKI